MRKLLNRVKAFLGIQITETYILTYKLRGDQKIPFTIEITVEIDDPKEGPYAAAMKLKETLPKCHLVDIELKQ